MDKIAFKDGIYDRADFEDLFTKPGDFYIEIAVCESFEDFHEAQECMTDDYAGLSQLHSAKSFDDLFIRVQKAKRTILCNIEEYDNCYEPDEKEIKYNKSDSAYIEADRVKAYIGYADACVCYMFTNLSKISFKYVKNSIIEWNPGDFMILFPYRGDVWALSKGYY